MKKFLFAFLSLPLTLIAQKGIEFEHGALWKDVVEKASLQKKYIFVDAYATWCGPCKYMAANIFPNPAVGEAFNSSFINVKVQMDTSAKDNGEVKKWYADAHAIGKDYNVIAYPTFLFFSPEGKLVHRIVGSMEAQEFIAKAKSLLDVNNQYYPMLDKYKSGNRDTEFLKKLSYATEDAYDAENMKLVSNDYLATQKNYLTEYNIDFIYRFTQGSKDAGFSILLDNEAKFNQAKKNLAATEKLVDIIKKEELNPYLKRKNGNNGPDWKTISTYISKKYPGQADEVMSSGKVAYYQSNHDWANFQPAVEAYMNKYGEKVAAAKLNAYAWSVFENCDNRDLIKEALNWSKRSFAEKEDPACMDTYANLLYKLGQKEEAIKWEEKAMSKLSDEERSDYKAAIEKMKKGEKTWKE